MSGPTCPPYEYHETTTPIQAVHVEVVEEHVVAMQPPPPMSPLSAPLSPRPPQRQPSRDTANSGTNTVDLTPFCATCCSITSVFCKLPDCIGCRMDTVMLCFNWHFRCCNTTKVPNEVCLCNESRCTCIVPTVCCSGQSQCCCLDSRCALPCNKEVPCMVGLCFIMCCYNCQCKVHFCQTIGRIDHKDNVIIRE